MPVIIFQSEGCNTRYSSSKRLFFFSVLGPVRDHILHLTTGRETIHGCTRIGISEGITEGIGGPITSVEETEDSTRGASIIEAAMEITGPTGKITAKLIALVGAVHDHGHPREGLHHRGLEAILEILTSLHLIGQGGRLHLGPPLITAEGNPPSVDL